MGADDAIPVEITPKGRWVLERWRELEAKGWTRKVAFEMACAEADLWSWKEVQP